MLSTRDQLQFEPRYRLEYSKAKEEEENSCSLGEAMPTNSPKGGNPETSCAR